MACIKFLDNETEVPKKFLPYLEEDLINKTLKNGIAKQMKAKEKLVSATGSSLLRSILSNGIKVYDPGDAVKKFMYDIKRCSSFKFS